MPDTNDAEDSAWLRHPSPSTVCSLGRSHRVPGAFSLVSVLAPGCRERIELQDEVLLPRGRTRA
jgi:hypothetical protein